MTSDRIPEHKELEADIVVVGGGGAGLAAATAAAEKGASVIVLEMRGSTGGSSALAGGPFACESPAQRRQRIIAHKDDIFKKAMSWAHWKIDPLIVRAFVDKSGDTIEWLEEKGLYFTCMKHGLMDNPMTWHVAKGEGAELMKALAKECKKLGITVLTHTPGKEIITGPDGSITGVLAEGKEGRIKIKTRNVIISSGGFAGNKELLNKYCPNYRDNMLLRGVPNLGDGLVMATKVGAATEGLGMLLSGAIGFHRSATLYTGTEPQPIQILSIFHRCSLVWVNKNGKRFIDESIADVSTSFESINAIYRQPDGLFYGLLDTKMIQTIAEEELTSIKLPGLEVRLQKKVKSGTNDVFKKADTWNEIAEWMGADPKVLNTTIDDYNKACDVGHDKIFVKDREYLLPLRTAPYYAIRCAPEVMNTVGGIKINENMEVLDEQANPIPGLYAAGVDTGGWMADTYCALCPGTAFGYALNSGRIAGENAASQTLTQ